MKLLQILFLLCTLCSWHSYADDTTLNSQLADLKNFQINTPTMMSAGLPNQSHFETLKSAGVNTVIDLIPGDRANETKMVTAMGLSYANIAVDWENPTLENFKTYVNLMKKSASKQEKVLTHCRLNWRGAVFTYLYRVTQLQESEAIAKRDMHAIWQPNDTWKNFIKQVKNHYN